MGLFDRGKPEEDQESQADWLAERARVANFLYRARTFGGTGPEDPTLAVQLRPDERALLVATGTYLVEPRRLRAHFKGAPGTITFAVTRVSGPGAGIDPVADRGLTPLDSGDLTFTTQRVVFSGPSQTRDWEFANLIGFEHFDRPSATAIATTDHERLTGFVYDVGQAEEIRFAVAVGIARFNGQLDALVADLQSQLDEIDRQHPEAQPVAAAASPAPATASASPLAGIPAQPVAASEPPPVPQPATPEQAIPRPLAPETAIPEPAVAEAAIPEPAVAEAAIPDPAVPEPAIAESLVDEPVVPEPALRNSEIDEQPAETPAASAMSDNWQPDQTNQGDTILPASPPLTWGSGADLGPTVTSLSPAADPRGAGPAGNNDEVSPTGEIPQVSTNPTEMYPAVGGGQYAGQAQQQYAQSGAGTQYGQQAAQQTAPQTAQQPAQPQGQAAGQTGTAQQMPPGWYPDPWRIARVRWWDGYAWTAYTSH